jgi:hypothetical protein
MMCRDLLSKFSPDELWYYLSMRHGFQNKPIKARPVTFVRSLRIRASKQTN